MAVPIEPKAFQELENSCHELVSHYQRMATYCGKLADTVHVA